MTETYGGAVHLFKSIIHAILLITTFSLSVPLQASVPLYRAHVAKRVLPNLYALSYDEVMLLLEEIDLGFYDDISFEEFQEIDEFIAVLAKQGELPGDSEGLDDDIEIFLSAYNSSEKIYLCDWFSKSWRNTRKFLKKHKKAIIIGAAIVIATVTIVGIATAASAGAVGTAGAVAQENKKKTAPQPIKVAALKETIQSEATRFKENLASEHYFDGTGELSMQESGRTVGSLFAHETIGCLNQQPVETSFAHVGIDQHFTTNYAPLFSASAQKVDFATHSYQLRGTKALELGYYKQAVQDLGRAIELNPDHSLSYLERGVAYFELGEFEQSVEDYHRYLQHTPGSLSIPAFSLGFCKKLPAGIYESGKGFFLLASDLVTKPVHTAGQMWDALSHLSTLIYSGEWEEVSKSLVPEVHELVTKWDTLSSEEKGERAGYAFGKYGADILIPGTVTKIASKGLKSAESLTAALKGFQAAEKTLLVESIAGFENTSKIAEIVSANKTTIALGEDIGLSINEMAQLKKAGRLHEAVGAGLDRLVSQTESEVLKTAIIQDRHINLVRGYLDKPSREIQKGINSYEKQITLHQDKIASPSKYYPEWDKLNPRRKEALINKKWPAEIRLYENQKAVLQSILKERINRAHG